MSAEVPSSDPMVRTILQESASEPSGGSTRSQGGTSGPRLTIHASPWPGSARHIDPSGMAPSTVSQVMISPSSGMGLCPAQAMEAVDARHAATNEIDGRDLLNLRSVIGPPPMICFQATPPPLVSRVPCPIRTANRHPPATWAGGPREPPGAYWLPDRWFRRHRRTHEEGQHGRQSSDVHRRRVGQLVHR